MRFYLIWIFSSILPLSLLAQYDAATQYVDFLDLNASRNLPYQLGKDHRTVGVMLPHFYAWLGNNFTNYGNLNEIATTTVLNNELVDKNYNYLRSRNHLSLGLEFQPLAFSIKIKTKYKEKDRERFEDEEEFEAKKDKRAKEIVTFSLSHTERVLANFAFGKDLFTLVWQGNNNNTFIGKQADLGYFRLNAIHLSETALGFAFPIFIQPKLPQLRVGGRLRYLQSIGNLYTERADLKMNTDVNGRYIDFDLNYKLHAAIDTNFAPNNMIGKGIGADIGAQASLLKETLKVGFSLLDLGAVRYNQHTYNFERANQYRYQGIMIDVLRPEQSGDIQIDTLTARFEPIETNQSYRTPLATRLVLQAEYHIGKKETKKKKHVYYEHNLYATYWQGFRTMYNGIIIPYLNVGYAYNLKNVLNPGINVGYGGFNRMTAGFSLGVRAGAFRLALTSNQALMVLVGKRLATGLDFGFHTGFVF